VLKVSRRTVREVLRSGSAEIPALTRAELYEPYRQPLLSKTADSSSRLTDALVD
jgi:hypothetical protein